MPKLVLMLDGAFLGEYALATARTLIGRRMDCDIHIDNLAISGVHAAVVVEDQKVLVEDMDSTNGTAVNGKPIRRKTLNHGDTIEMGRYQLRYLSDSVMQELSGEESSVLEVAGMTEAAAPVSGLPPLVLSTEAEVVVIEDERSAGVSDVGSVDEDTSAAPEVAPAPVALTLEAPTVQPALPIAQLCVLSGSNTGRVVTLNKSLVTLGKPGVQVAVISRRPQGYYVTHVEGEQFPLVNGLPVGRQARALVVGDEIEIAGIKMKFDGVGGVT